MIYKIRFGDQPLLYDRELISDDDVPPMAPLNAGEIYTTAGDIEEFASIVKSAEGYIRVTSEDIQNERFDLSAMRTVKHTVNIYGWEFLALYSTNRKAAYGGWIRLSFGGGEKLWTTEIGFGEPID